MPIKVTTVLQGIIDALERRKSRGRVVVVKPRQKGEPDFKVTPKEIGRLVAGLRRVLDRRRAYCLNPDYVPPPDGKKKRKGRKKKTSRKTSKKKR